MNEHVAQHHLDGCSAGADHGIQIWALPILGAVSFINAVIDRAIDRPEDHLLSHAGGDDPARFLLQSGLIPARIDSVVCLVRAAIDGVGLAFVSDEHVEPQFDSGELVRVLEDWCQPFPGFFLYYPSRRQQPAALSALINTLRL